MDDAAQGIVAVLQAAALFVLPLAAWLLLRPATHLPPRHRVYSRPGWNFFLKVWWARLVLRMLRKQRRSKALGVGMDCVAARLNINTGPADTLLPTKLEEQLEAPRDLTDQETEDSMWLWGGDASSGAMVVLRVDRRCKRAVPDMSLLLRLPDGNTYTIPQEELSVGQRAPPPVKQRISACRKIWSVRGLQLETLEPLRRWRIRFNGLLRRITDGTPPDDGNSNRDVIEPVSFSFMWTAASNPVELRSDWNLSLLAQALAREPWRNGNWLSMADEWGDGYDQWGVMRGAVRVGADDHAKTHAMYLRGLRRRHWGLRHARWVYRAVSMAAWAPGAGRRMALLALGSASASGTSHALWGHVQEADGEQETVRDTDLSLEALAEHPDAPPEHFVVRLQAGQRHYTLDVYPLLHCAERRLTRDGLLQLVAPFVCTFSNVQAQGVIEIWYRTEGVHLPSTIRQNMRAAENEVLEEEDEIEEDEDSKKRKKKEKKREKKRDEPIIVFLEDERCRKERLVGGKGASLAAMRALSHTQVRVPGGFCLTVHALEHQLQTSCALLESVNNVGRASIAAACNGDDALVALRSACERAEKMLKEKKMHARVDAEVRSALQRLVNEDAQVRLAVRSSALGEDSEELSAAGQNATLLGLRGADAVIAAIHSCWASLFSFQSVAYRRQYGQPIDCGMGIVVQVMVPADKAGVLFTQHPVTASPNQMLITANYGLGETVVSAQVEPDSIVVARELNGTLSITELTCGSKRVRIQMADDGGTWTEELGEKSGAAQEPCLSHEEILRLAQLGLQIENAFEGPRDIEWAIAKGEIYLLQSRPITSLDQWTDAELLHEFDSPITSDTDLNTFGNTGEVFPKICSPLGLSIVGPVLDRGTSSSMKVRPRIYCTRHLSFTHNRIMLNMHTTVFRALEEKLSTGFKVFEIAIFGHPVTTAEYHRYGLQRSGPLGMKGRVLNVVEGLEASLKNKGIARKAQKMMESIQVHKTKYTSPEILHMAIAQSLKKVKMISDCHNSTSRVSVFSQIVTMSILTEGSEELTADHYSDIALLLSSCSDVVSADVPKDIKDLADTIVRTGRGQEFCILPVHLAAEWLEANLQVSQKYKNFLQKHGHRGIQEFDVMTETWELKPQAIVGTLQTMVDASGGQTKARETPLSPEDTVARLKTIKSEKVRSVLGLLLPWCRSTVARRELTKAALIGGIHRLRLSYRRLAHMLLTDGRLPDLQLIFFFTHFELGKYITTGSPLYIAKALRRRRLWPAWEKLQFPEVVLGIPEPINAMVRPPGGEGETSRLKGTPVWAGTVMGRACVIMQLSEISQLQRGDILITRGTDIGWSPYFPMLGGVVTELGGLISHGAVVAREYGLPCIVGAAGATDMFKTGDTVLLVGENGTLEKLDG